HTSLIRFLEARYGHRSEELIETNITPWRRAVSGDLTSAFDFKLPNTSTEIALPDTDAFKPQTLVSHPDYVPVPPANQAVPGQEPGLRRARVLPYALPSNGHVGPDGAFHIEFRNTGEAAAVFHVRAANGADAPRSYTVEPDKKVSDKWSTENYDLSVYGPNGFFRHFKGSLSDGRALDIREFQDEESGAIGLELSSHDRNNIDVHIVDRYQHITTNHVLESGDSFTKRWPLKVTWGWYDLTVTVAGNPGFEYQFAGHIENGKDSMSDPAMGGLI